VDAVPISCDGVRRKGQIILEDVGVLDQGDVRDQGQGCCTGLGKEQ